MGIVEELVKMWLNEVCDTDMAIYDCDREKGNSNSE